MGSDPSPCEITPTRSPRVRLGWRGLGKLGGQEEGRSPTLSPFLATWRRSSGGAMEKRERGRSLVSLLIFGAVAVCACVAIGQLGGRREGRTSELVEIDGIELDANAARALSGSSSRGASRSRTAYPADPTNKLLKQHAADVLDGVALDTNAEKTLHPLRRGRGSNHGHHASKEASGGGQSATDPGQALLEKGESELDAQSYGEALKDLQGARDTFKREHRSDWRWAQTLIADVLHAHPKLESSKAASSSSAVETGAGVSEGQQGGPKHSSPTFPMGRGRTVRRAAKELAAGKQFRSLYGLARDEHQTHRREPGEAKKAATSSLSQVHRTGGVGTETRESATLRKLVDDSVRRAERRLAAKNRLALLHEEAALRRQYLKPYQESQGGGGGSALKVQRTTLVPQYTPNMVQQQQQQQQRIAAQATQGQEQQAMQIAPLKPLPGQAPVTSFSSSTSPDQAASIGVQQAQLALGRLSRHKAFSQALDQVPSALQQQQQQQQLVQPSLTVQEEPSAQDPALSGQVSSAVPVVNLNLAPGQKLAPGKYEMDGQLVPDAQGQYNFVGDLVPRLAPTANADPMYMQESADPTR